MASGLFQYIIPVVSFVWKICGEIIGKKVLLPLVRKGMWKVTLAIVITLSVFAFGCKLYIDQRSLVFPVDRFKVEKQQVLHDLVQECGEQGKGCYAMLFSVDDGTLFKNSDDCSIATWSLFGNFANEDIGELSSTANYWRLTNTVLFLKDQTCIDLVKTSGVHRYDATTFKENWIDVYDYIDTLHSAITQYTLVSNINLQAEQKYLLMLGVSDDINCWNKNKTKDYCIEMVSLANERLIKVLKKDE